MFCIVVSPVLGASIPVVSKLVLRGPAAEPPKTHIHHLAPTQNNSVVNNPAAVKLSVWMGLLGPWQCGIISRAVMKRAASSDLAVDAITNLMIWAMERTAPLKCG